MNVQPGIELIKQFEGLRLAPYICPAGKRTVGYGHTKNVSTEAITELMAEALLMSDVADCLRALDELVFIDLNSNQASALLSFVFNVGRTNLGTSTLLYYVNRGQHHLATNQFERWKYAGRKVLPGLVKRRAAEAALYAKAI